MSDARLTAMIDDVIESAEMWAADDDGTGGGFPPEYEAAFAMMRAAPAMLAALQAAEGVIAWANDLRPNDLVNAVHHIVLKAIRQAKGGR